MDYNNGFSLSSFFLSLRSFLWIGAQFPQEKFLSYGRILTLHYYFLLMCILFSFGVLLVVIGCELWTGCTLSTPGLDYTRLFISLTAGAGTRSMSLLVGPPPSLSFSFHFVLSLGAVIGIFSGIIFNGEKIFGKNLLSSSSCTLSLYHLVSTFIGILLTFSPMHFLGFNVMVPGPTTVSWPRTSRTTMKTAN